MFTGPATCHVLQRQPPLFSLSARPEPVKLRFVSACARLQISVDLSRVPGEPRKRSTTSTAATAAVKTVGQLRPPGISKYGDTTNPDAQNVLVIWGFSWSRASRVTSTAVTSVSSPPMRPFWRRSSRGAPYRLPFLLSASRSSNSSKTSFGTPKPWEAHRGYRTKCEHLAARSKHPSFVARVPGALPRDEHISTTPSDLPRPDAPPPRSRQLRQVRPNAVSPSRLRHRAC